jgi:hypothetical protein
MTTKSVDLTEPQRVLLTTLTDQRVANLINLADVIGDMNVDGLEFLRRLGDPRPLRTSSPTPSLKRSFS